MDGSINTNAYPPSRYTHQLGFYAALATVILTLITFAIAVMTPPLSGPYCTDGCFEYPFADIASRFPRDYYWMYPAMFLFASYAVLLICIHGYADQSRKVYSGVGLFFGLFSAAVFIVDFFVQVSVIPPSLANGETDGIALISQFNAHGVFIVLEELGYILMSISFLFLAPVFSGSKLSNAIRWLFLMTFFLTFAAFAYYNFTFGIFREYRFEVTVITISWLSLIVSGILLSILFRRSYKSTSE